MSPGEFTWTEEVLPEPHPAGGYEIVRTFSTGEVVYYAELIGVGEQAHRTDGPARTFPGGRSYFYVRGARQNVTDFLAEYAGHPEIGFFGLIEKTALTKSVGDGVIVYDALLEALDQGAPWEWAVAYAKGEAP